MSVADKVLTCRDCHKAFVWTAGEQAFFREKGLLNIPARCDECRETRRPGGSPSRRPRTSVTCAMCGKATTVPFVPRNGKPIYCSSCLVNSREEAPTGAPVAVEVSRSATA